MKKFTNSQLAGLIGFAISSLTHANTTGNGLVSPYRGMSSIHAEAITPLQAIQNLQKQIDTFNETQEKRIAALEAGSNTDSIDKEIENMAENILAMQKQLDDMAINTVANQLSGNVADAEYSAEFSNMFRTGQPISAKVEKGNKEKGGYLAPIEWDRTISKTLTEVSPIRRLCNVITISTAGFSRLYQVDGVDCGWVGEDDERPNTGTPSFKTMDFTTGEVYANPTTTQEILDDAEINIESWLATEVSEKFTEVENKAFIDGDGVKKPTGLLTFAEGGTNATTHPLGAIEVIESGVTNGLNEDSLIDLVYSLKTSYQQNAVFTMTKLTSKAVRKLKDKDGNSLWQPSLQKGEPATLMGYPVEIVDDMPQMAVGSLAIGFGDLKRTYTIIDRIGIRVIRDEVTKKSFVQFYTTKRVGGSVDNPEAFKLLKISA